MQQKYLQEPSGAQQPWARSQWELQSSAERDWCSRCESGSGSGFLAPRDLAEVSVVRLASQKAAVPSLAGRGQRASEDG